MHDAKAAIRKAGERIASEGLPEELTPLTIGIAGYGNVANGVREILSELPTREVAPGNLEPPSRTHLPTVSTRPPSARRTWSSPQDGRAFELQDYYDHPEGYRSVFDQYLPQLTVLMNCNYWDERYPRLVTKEQLRAMWSGDTPPRLRVIGDLGCDVEGAIECTLKCTEPSDPIYVYDPHRGDHHLGRRRIRAGGVGGGHPSRRAAARGLRGILLRAQSFLPALAKADFDVPFSELALPPELLGAVIAHRGKLTPDFLYLEAHLAAADRG